MVNVRSNDLPKKDNFSADCYREQIGSVDTGRSRPMVYDSGLSNDPNSGVPVVLVNHDLGSEWDGLSEGLSTLGFRIRNVHETQGFPADILIPRSSLAFACFSGLADRSTPVLFTATVNQLIQRLEQMQQRYRVVRVIVLIPQESNYERGVYALQNRLIEKSMFDSLILVANGKEGADVAGRIVRLYDTQLEREFKTKCDELISKCKVPDPCTSDRFVHLLSQFSTEVGPLSLHDILILADVTPNLGALASVSVSDLLDSSFDLPTAESVVGFLRQDFSV